MWKKLDRVDRAIVIVFLLNVWVLGGIVLGPNFFIAVFVALMLSPTLYMVIDLLMM